MQLFKYLKKEHMDGFFSRGNLRIGTLSGYRQDSYGVMVRDEREGIKTAGGYIEHVEGEEIRKNDVLSHLFGGEGNIIIDGCTFENIRIVSPNLYIFSAASSYSPEIHIRWMREEGYDACYSINSSSLFLEAISRAIRGKAEFLAIAPVVYHIEDSIDIQSPAANLHPSVLKPGTDYGDQNEIRAIWQPLSKGPIKPLIIDVPEAIKYCSVHAVLDNT